MANDSVKSCSTSYIIKEFQSKITLRYLYTPMRMANVKTHTHTHKPDNTKCCKFVDQPEVSSIAGGNAKIVQPLWK